MVIAPPLFTAGPTADITNLSGPSFLLTLDADTAAESLSIQHSRQPPLVNWSVPPHRGDRWGNQGPEGDRVGPKLGKRDRTSGQLTDNRSPSSRGLEVRVRGGGDEKRGVVTSNHIHDYSKNSVASLCPLRTGSRPQTHKHHQPTIKVQAGGDFILRSH